MSKQPAHVAAGAISRARRQDAYADLLRDNAGDESLRQSHRAELLRCALLARRSVRSIVNRNGQSDAGR